MQILIAVLASVAVFIGMILISRKFTGEEASARHKDRLLNQIQEEQDQMAQSAQADNASILKADAGPLARTLMAMPMGQEMYELVLKAGLGNSLSAFLLGCLGLFFVLLVLLGKMLGIGMALVAAILLTIMLPRMWLKRKIAKRNEKFINMFPDAVDMIVRSVKSGHPLNTALRMIAENMDPPVRSEFKQLVDEIAFGRSTTEALVRMSKRVDEPDLHFFVVILSVQQETGGNLAEVLGNLSTIIRKRKQLRLKIHAMTSEGRATAMILGALPFVVFGAIKLTSPGYLDPLFTNPTGQMILVGALSLIALSAFIVRNMLQIDI
ncbi:MAG: type II secretion system F family protein [Rickettsiales bacterium]